MSYHSDDWKVDFSQAQRAYYADVLAIVDDVTEAVRDGDCPADEARDFIHESVDASAWVIYTYGAKLVACFLTDNEDAHEDFGYETAPDWSVRAFCSMYQDVLDRCPDFDEIEAEREGADDE